MEITSNWIFLLSLFNLMLKAEAKFYHYIYKIPYKRGISEPP
jgi:hypothetical protein